jgi:Dyp-type peroxidase family
VAVFEPDSDTATGPLIDGAPVEEMLRGDEIQGAVLPGFGTSSQHLFALRWPEPDALRAFLASEHANVSTLTEVLAQRNLRRAALRRGQSRPRTPVLRAVALSMAGLTMVTPDATDIRDMPFKAGMAARSPYLGDPRTADTEGHPSRWLFGGKPKTVPHVVVILAAEWASDLDTAADELRAAVQPVGTVIWEQRGAVLPGEIEHFGFRDGVSQVGVRGRLSDSARHFLTRRWFAPDDQRAKEYARPGQPLVWPGQFVFGYQVGDSDDALDPGQVKTGGPEWTRDGSLLVLRRLRQDVAAFRRFASAESARLRTRPGFEDMTEDKLMAKIVGRWPDGSALARTPDHPDTDEATDMLRTNAFDYGHKWAEADVCSDPRVAREELGAFPPGELRTVPGAEADRPGLRCPAFAHIRKVNPRGLNTDQSDAPLSTRQSQMVRRGITWGTAYSDDADDDGDRGLLFMSYQTSIDRQFEKLTTKWMNLEDPPEGPSGHDLLVGQNNNGGVRRAVLRSDDPGHAAVAEPISTDTPWIVATGGEYLFAPAVSALRRFARQPLVQSPGGG